MAALPPIGEGMAPVSTESIRTAARRPISPNGPLPVRRHRIEGYRARLATGTVWQPVCQSCAEMPARSCAVLRDSAPNSQARAR